MKRFFTVAALLSAVALMMTSCLYGTSSTTTNSALASIVDGDALTGSYVMFDNGVKATIVKGENLVGNIPASAYYPDKATGEARAVIHFVQKTSSDDNFVSSLELKGVIPIQIIPAEPKYNQEVADGYKSWLTGYGLTYTRDRYLNIQFTYPSSGGTYESEHDFVLMYNPEKQGYFQELYTTDSYLYLELYHDGGLDPAAHVTSGSVSLGESILSFYLTDEMINRDIDKDFYGVRVLYRGRDETSSNIVPRVLEFRFSSF